MDENRYGELLKEIRPRVIETPEEHERLLLVAESMMDRGDALSDEEREMLGLLVLLIEAFESNVLEEDEQEEEEASEDEEAPAPHVTLRRLMDSHKLDIEDVASIFGNPHLTREVLAGKRPISRGQAKQLGVYFKVPPKLFQE